jgi:manganese/iron transport system permease protein/iron/zinc/copper transport system permease protein
LNYLTEPLDYEFMRHGIIAATLVGAMCGLIGVYVVLRRMSYIGHGMSHAVFGGAVVGYVMGWNFYLVSGVWGFISALAIAEITRRRNIGADAAIGIVTTASFAFGVALISRSRHFTRNFDAALFGNLLGITNSDLLLIAGTAIGLAGVVFFFYKQLLFVTFDPEVAPSYGVPSQWVDVIFSLSLAATIIVSIKILGVTLIAASLVIPPVVARLLGDSFSRMLVTSTVVGALTGLVGVYISYYGNIASGATIVLVAAGLFVLVYIWSLMRSRIAIARGSAVTSPRQVEDLL